MDFWFCPLDVALTESVLFFEIRDVDFWFCDLRNPSTVFTGRVTLYSACPALKVFFLFFLRCDRTIFCHATWSHYNSYIALALRLRGFCVFLRRERTIFCHVTWMCDLDGRTIQRLPCVKGFLVEMRPADFFVL